MDKTLITKNPVTVWKTIYSQNYKKYETENLCLKASDTPYEYNYIFSSKTNVLFKKLLSLLKKNGYKKIHSRAKSYIYAEGNSPVMLIAHIDTVKNPTPFIGYDTEKQIIFNSDIEKTVNYCGIGADDRAGVIAILEIMKDFKPHILFTDGEETGCCGARDFITDFKEMKNINLLIELDRKGSKDCIFYKGDGNDDLIKYIEGFGFEKAYGSYTDICVLAPAWKIGGVNLSVGYYDNHSEYEILKLNELNSTIEKVKNILRNPPDKKFDYAERKYYASTIDDWEYEYSGKYSTSKYSEKWVPSEIKIIIEEYYLMKNFGGRYFDWYEWLKKNSTALKSEIMERVDEVIIDYLEKNIPDFIMGDSLKEDKKNG